jgi:cytochrome c oxidase subunit II
MLEKGQEIMQHAWRRLAALSAVSMMPFAASAQQSGGPPVPWQMGLPESASLIMDDIITLNTWLFWLITVISIFVLGLLVYCAVKFNEKANPVPSKTTHNTTIEVVWTVVPVLILIAIVIPSFRLLKLQDDIPKTDITIKVTGKQWYWTVEYAKDAGGITFDAIMLDDKQRADAMAKGAKPGDVPRLLAVDNEIVLPINKAIRVQITAADVLHAFTIPAFGIKRDAVPGRLNETWFRATKEGIYYGQCSELCGTNHAFMPAAVRIVSEAKYAEWLEGAKKKYASTTGEGAIRTAAGDAPAAKQ